MLLPEVSGIVVVEVVTVVLLLEVTGIDVEVVTVVLTDVNVFAVVGNAVVVAVVDAAPLVPTVVVLFVVRKSSCYSAM